MRRCQAPALPFKNHHCGPAALSPVCGFIKSFQHLLKTARGYMVKFIPWRNSFSPSKPTGGCCHVYQSLGSASQSFQTLPGEFCSFYRPKMN